MPDDFQDRALDDIERLLIHSAVSALDDDEWATAFPYLSAALVEMLAHKGVVLVGLDSPSVDAFESKDLPCHHALRRYGMVNLESLCLRDVPDGDYELFALPLKLDLTCGSPVRAILRSL
jgi:arylformamidase